MCLLCNWGVTTPGPSVERARKYLHVHTHTQAHLCFCILCLSVYLPTYLPTYVENHESACGTVWYRACEEFTLSLSHWGSVPCSGSSSSTLYLDSPMTLPRLLYFGSGCPPFPAISSTPWKSALFGSTKALRLNYSRREEGWKEKRKVYSFCGFSLWSQLFSLYSPMQEVGVMGKAAYLDGDGG